MRRWVTAEEKGSISFLKGDRNLLKIVFNLYGILSHFCSVLHSQIAVIAHCNFSLLKLNDFFCRIKFVANWLTVWIRDDVLLRRNENVTAFKSYDKHAGSSNNERERDGISNDTKVFNIYKTRKKWI